MTNKRINIFLVFSFGVLGLTAIVYQIVFAKKLIFLFGMSAPAIATVLAVYFSGMALGSYYFGKLADKYQDHSIYKIYFMFFVLAGIYGLLFPWMFKMLNALILAVDKIYSLDFAGFNLFSFIFSFVVLIFPAIFLGGGFPVLSRIFILRDDVLGKRVSQLYFVNTFGSVIGAVMTGFLFLPSFGIANTLSLASWSNLSIAALLFILLSKQISFKGHESDSAQVKKGPETKAQKAGINNPVFFYSLFVTGFLSIALEVFYTKTMILFIGSSTYAFSLILIVFLLGIALGSLTDSWFIDKSRLNPMHFGIILSALGVWIFLTIQGFDYMPYLYIKILGFFESLNFPAIVSTLSYFMAITIFPAAFCIGLIFPLGIKLAAPGFRKLGENIGGLYFINTFGGVLGSLMAGFVLIPKLGYQKTLTIIMFVYLFLGAFFILRDNTLKKTVRIIVVLLLVLLTGYSVFSSPWSRKLLSLGIFPYARDYLDLGYKEFRERVKYGEIIYYNEGLSNVAVIKEDRALFLRINGKTDASNYTGDLETFILQGALPMVLHPDPKEVLLIGLGSGITLGTVTQFDEVKNIDTVEIDPAVVQAADYFKRENHDALKDPRVNMIVSDARIQLYLSDKKYDVITSEPSNLWVSGNVNLFTREFYELAKSRLKDNGIMFQWIHTYALEKEDIVSIFKTFQEVFPQTYIFDTHNLTDLFLIGSLNKDPTFDFDLFVKKFKNQKVKDELSRIFIRNPYELAAYFVASSERIKEIGKNIKIHTDDLTFIEYSSSKAIYKDSSSDILKMIADMREKTNPADIIVGGDAEKREKYYTFSKKLMPYKVKYLEFGYLKAIDDYLEAKKTGLDQMFIEMQLLSDCSYFLTQAQRENNVQKANEISDKCSQVFSKGQPEL